MSVETSPTPKSVCVTALEWARERALDNHIGRMPGADVGEPSAQEVEILLHDPHVTESALDLSTKEVAVEDADAVVIVTAHEEFADLEPSDFESKAGNLLLDTRAVLDVSRWENAGYTVRRI